MLSTNCLVHFSLAAVLVSCVTQTGGENGADAGASDVGYDTSDSPSSGDGLGGDTSSEDLRAGSIVITNLQATENPENRLSFYVEWQTDSATASRLEVTCGDYYNERFSDQGERTQHSAFVMGLRAETSCDFVAQAVDESELRSFQSITVEVASLPDWLPVITATYADSQLLQPGWTLFNLHNRLLELPPSVVLVDRDGYVRWYYRSEIGFTIGNDVRTVPEGVLMETPSQIVDWEGSAVWRQPLPVHHDIRTIGDEGHLLYLSRTNCPDDQPEADLVVEYDRNLDEVVWQWSICEHYTPPQYDPDWSHLNTIEPFPGEQALLISSRHQNAVFKVNMQTDEVVWRLGVDGDFEMSEEDLFYNQHAPEIESNGNILLFDNGAEHRRYSRAIELAYTQGDEWEAEVVWEFIPQPRIFSFSWGDADLLANGNRLTVFGVEFPEDGDSRIFEVTANTPASVVWELAFPNGWSMYRAERVVDPPTGYIVED